MIQTVMEDNTLISNISEREEALRISEQHFRAYFERSMIGMAATSPEKRCLEVNDRLCEIIGYSKEQLIQKTWEEITCKEDIEEQNRLFNKVLRGEADEYEMEKRFIHQDGHVVYAYLRSSCIRNKDGSVDYFIVMIEDISARKQIEEKLRESEARMRAIIKNEPECIKIIDSDGILIEMNPAGLEMIEADSLDQVSGHPVLEVIAPEYRAAYSVLLDRVMSGEAMEMEYEVLGLHGGRRFLETHAVPMEDNGKTIHLAITRDISERKKAQEKLHLAASVFTHAREGIIITSPDGTIIDINDAFSRITGYSRDEIVGQNPRILSSKRHGKKFYSAMWHDLIEKGHWYGEIWNRRKNGEVYAEMLTISSIVDSQENVQNYVALFSDITTIKEHEQHLERIAHYDALTSLPNRTLLSDRMQNAITLALRNKQKLAVVYLDLDGFKQINDTYGHDVGDQLLVVLASRMGRTLRHGDTLARLGGDEFVAVLIDLDNTAASIPMINRLLSAASESVRIGEHSLKISASLGITFFPQADDVDADQLLRQADNAMYQAKLSGKNCYHVFDIEQDRNIRGHHESVERIRQALNNDEFILYYQPKVNMRTGAIIGAEALIRWNHPIDGILAPALFLPIIENHPLAIDIGEWVINTALKQLECWHSEGLIIPISVNVGARQLQQENFVRRLHEFLLMYPSVLPSFLELEVLETSALEDINWVSRIMEECREFGVNFALDDFGTGYSSLTYLKRLPITLLKIDQSFVRNMLDDPDDLAILEGVIGLAKAFNRDLIAEGVETIEHGEMLLQLGCELAQGYGISHPIPVDEFSMWAKSWYPDAAWTTIPFANISDLPLLYAGAEHRAWISATERYLSGEREVLMPQDHHQCRFGRWMDTDGAAKYGKQSAFHTIQSIHQQIHTLVEQLVVLHSKGEETEVLSHMGELHRLRNSLLEQLKLLAYKQ